MPCIAHQLLWGEGGTPTNRQESRHMRYVHRFLLGVHKMGRETLGGLRASQNLRATTWRKAGIRSA